MLSGRARGLAEVEPSRPLLYAPSHSLHSSITPPPLLFHASSTPTSSAPPPHLLHTSSTPPPHFLHTSSTPPPHLLHTSAAPPQHLLLCCGHLCSSLPMSSHSDRYTRLVSSLSLMAHTRYRGEQALHSTNGTCALVRRLRGGVRRTLGQPCIAMYSEDN